MCRFRLALPVLAVALLGLPVPQAASAAAAGRQPTVFARTAIQLGPFRVLTVRTCLEAAPPAGTGRPVAAPVTLQYRRSPAGRWHRLLTIRPAPGNYCASLAPAWRATARAPATNGYYRLSFAGTAALRPSASPVVHLRRDLTRITSFQVVPHQVGRGAAITITGRLWRYTTTWLPYAGRHVVILFRYQGDWYYFLAKPRTNALGYFSGRFTARVTARWIAQYDGDAAHFGSATRSVAVTVNKG